MSAFLRKYATASTVYFPLIGAGTVNFTSTATLTTADMKISIDGAAFATVGTAITNVGSFGYSYTFTTADLTGKCITMIIHHTAGSQAFEDSCLLIETFGNSAAQHTWDLSVANVVTVNSIGTSVINANAIAAGAISAGGIAANAISAGGIATAAITSAKIATGGLDPTNFAAGFLSAGGIATAAITSAKIATGGLDPTNFAAGFLSAGGIAASAISSGAFAVGAIDGTALNASAITKIENGVWNASTSSHLTSGTFGLMNKIIRDGTAAGGGSATITLDAGAAVGTADLYTGSQVYIYGGVGTNQAARVIVGYNSGTRVATVSPPWQVAPDATSLFIITPQTMGALGTDLRVLITAQTHTAGALVTIPTSSLVIAGTVSDKTGYSLTQAFPSNFADLSISATTGAVKILAGNIGSATFAAGAINAAAIAAGAISAGGIAANAISAGGIATDAIDADALASDAVAEIWAQALTQSTAVPTITSSVLSAFAWMYALSRNQITQTATVQTIYQTDGTTPIASSAVSDDGTTFTRAIFTS